MSQVSQLYRLQQIDTEIQQKKGRLSEVIRLQRETEEVMSAKKRAQEAEEELQKWQKRQNNLNLELMSLNNETERTNQRLYSGNVRNPKELEDLEHKVQELGRRKDGLEDDLLEAMIMIEEAQEEKEKADASLADVERDWNETQKSLQQEQNELALRLHDLTEARQKQVGLIEGPLLSQYQRLVSHKGGVGVAGLVNNRCTGCHLTVSANKVSRAGRGEIVTCGGCGRILCPL